MSKPRILGVILARGGSKGVPRKNLREFAGVPLIAYTILEAKRSRFIDRLIVSSEDEEIRRTAIAYGAEAPFERPAEMAADNVSSHPAFEHAVAWAEADEGREYDFIIDLMCTNPLKTADDIDAVLEKLIETGAESVIAVTPLEDHHPIRIKKIEDDRIRDFCLPEIPGTNRQDLKPDAYIRNGSIYSCRRDCIARRMQTPDSRPYVMAPERSVNIDTPMDAVLADVLLQHFSRPYIKKVPVPPPGGPVSYAAPTGVERRVLITQTPIGAQDRAPLDHLEAHGVDYTFNPKGKILNEDEMAGIMSDYGIVLSGTSALSRKVIERAPHLRFISRAGIGLDCIDLAAARERGIAVSYTPDAPAPAVAEFTLGLMLSLGRHIARIDRALRAGNWGRAGGLRLANATVGIIGVGRTGKRVAELVSAFGATVLGHDIAPDPAFGEAQGLRWTDPETLFKESDIVTLHVPLTRETRHMVGARELAWMKADALLINTARGGVVDEASLAKALNEGTLQGAALDVFENEPYDGPLLKMENCLLSCHMAAASPDSSRAMELGAAEEIVRFLAGEPLQGLVGEEEYRRQADSD